MGIPPFDAVVKELSRLSGGGIYGCKLRGNDERPIREGTAKQPRPLPGELAEAALEHLIAPRFAMRCGSS
jgi:hypothetical protein